MTVAEIQTLIAGIDADFLDEQIWRQWTEYALQKVSSVPVWLVELYEAENSKDALVALYCGWHKAESDDAPLNQTELYLGFLYLSHLAGKLNLPKLLLEAGEFSDKANFDNPSCEAFYLLLNEYEEREGALSYNSSTFSGRVENLFSGFAELAKRQIASLQRAG